MKVAKRYISEWEFPNYAFLPGKQVHPNKPGGHMFGKKEPEAMPVDKSDPKKSEILRYAVDLFNHEYYWESHVYLEALWNAHGRKGEVANFFKAIILLSAAGVKFKLGQSKPGVGHLKRSLELIDAIDDKVILGFNLDNIRELTLDSLNLGTPSLNVKIYPVW